MPDARKVALVVGNEAYEHAGKLAAPRRDAIAVASLCERLGFSVAVGFDCSFVQFRKLVDDFHDRLDPQAVALFYFSGHGIQGMDGSNHILPVDAELADPRDLGRVTMKLDDLLDAMRARARVSLIFLDACRDDPFAGLAGAAGTKSVYARRPGLAAVPTARLGQALIAFAAEEGHTALDAGGGLSPFTEALVSHLDAPGRDIRDTLGEVRRAVMAKTDGRQTPWTKEALTEEVVLVPGPDAPSPPPAVAAEAGVAPVVRQGASARRWRLPAAVLGLAVVAGAGWAVSGRPGVVCALPGTGGVVRCEPILRGIDRNSGASIATAIPLLDHTSAGVRSEAARVLTAAFFGALPEAEQVGLARRLIDVAKPQNLMDRGDDARNRLFDILGAIPEGRWREPRWIEALAEAHDAVDALDDRIAAASLDLAPETETFLASFRDRIGYVPRASLRVRVFHGSRLPPIAESPFMAGWIFSQRTAAATAAGKAEVRYGDAPEAMALLLAFDLGRAARRKVKTFQDFRVPDGVLEVWIGDQGD